MKKIIHCTVIFLFLILIFASCDETPYTLSNDQNSQTGGDTYVKSDAYRIFGRGYGEYSYVNEALENQVEMFSRSIGKYYVKDNFAYPKLTEYELFNNNFSIQYKSTSEYVTSGICWDIYEMTEKSGKNNGTIELYFSPEGDFLGFYDKLKEGHLVNLGDISEMTIEEIREKFEKLFSIYFDFSEFNEFSYQKRELVDNKYDLEWNIQINGYKTNRKITATIYADGSIMSIRFYIGSILDGLNFNITSEQKEQEIQKILAEKLKTSSTEYNGTYSFLSSPNEEVILKYNDKIYLYVPLINAKFNVIDDSCEHKNWYARTDVLIPLDDYIVTGN